MAAEECPGMELTGQSLEIAEKLFYLGVTMGARIGAD